MSKLPRYWILLSKPRNNVFSATQREILKFLALDSEAILITKSISFHSKHTSDNIVVDFDKEIFVEKIGLVLKLRCLDRVARNLFL